MNPGRKFTQLCLHCCNAAAEAAAGGGCPRRLADRGLLHHLQPTSFSAGECSKAPTCAPTTTTNHIEYVMLITPEQLAELDEGHGHDQASSGAASPCTPAHERSRIDVHVQASRHKKLSVCLCGDPRARGLVTREGRRALGPQQMGVRR